MRDLDIRRALHRALDEKLAHQPDTLRIDELGLEHGTVFVDVAVVNGVMHGYELKSARDTLARLPHQARAYSAVLDRATLVAAGEHLDQAVKMLPSWWGLTCAHDAGGAIVMEELRPPTMNPAPDPLSIAKLLWRDEALALLEQNGAARGARSKPRAMLYRRLVECLPLDSLRGAVRARLRSRTAWRAG